MEAVYKPTEPKQVMTEITFIAIGSNDMPPFEPSPPCTCTSAARASPNKGSRSPGLSGICDLVVVIFASLRENKDWEENYIRVGVLERQADIFWLL
jgi:hypothetical protein